MRVIDDASGKQLGIFAPREATAMARERNLKDGNCEVYYRLEDKGDVVSLNDAVTVVKRYYAE